MARGEEPIRRDCAHSAVAGSPPPRARMAPTWRGSPHVSLGPAARVGMKAIAHAVSPGTACAASDGRDGHRDGRSPCAPRPACPHYPQPCVACALPSLPYDASIFELGADPETEAYRAARRHQTETRLRDMREGLRLLQALHDGLDAGSPEQRAALGGLVVDGLPRLGLRT